MSEKAAKVGLLFLIVAIGLAGAYLVQQYNAEQERIEREKVFKPGLHDPHTGSEYEVVTDVADALGAKLLFLYSWTLDYKYLEEDLLELQRANDALAQLYPGDVAIVLYNVGEEADYYTKEYLEGLGITLAQVTGAEAGQEGLLFFGFTVGDGEWWSMGYISTDQDLYAVYGQQPPPIYDIITREADNYLEYLNE